MYEKENEKNARVNEPEAGKNPVFSMQSLVSHEKKKWGEGKRNDTTYKFLHIGRKNKILSGRCKKYFRLHNSSKACKP